MGKAHQNEKKTAQPKSETNPLATQKMINRNQTTPIQSSTQTRIDLWNSDKGGRLHFQHRNSPALSI
jgi:hypothetical protein